MAFTNAWDEDRPDGDVEEANTADDYFRDHRVDLGDRLEDMFYGFNAGSNLLKEGDYGVKQLRLKEQSAAPNLGTDEIRVYAKLVGTQAELFFKDEAGNEKQLTSGGKINVLDADGAVMKSGNQTVAGQKTFSDACAFSTASTLADASVLASSAAPTTDAMIANMKYVVDQITAITDPTYEGAQNHTFDGGLIIQMGAVVEAGTTHTVTFATAGIAFPTACIAVLPVGTSVATAGKVSITAKSKTAFSVVIADSQTGFNWIAVGH